MLDKPVGELADVLQRLAIVREVLLQLHRRLLLLPKVLLTILSSRGSLAHRSHGRASVGPIAILRFSQLRPAGGRQLGQLRLGLGPGAGSVALRADRGYRGASILYNSTKTTMISGFRTSWAHWYMPGILLENCKSGCVK